MIKTRILAAAIAATLSLSALAQKPTNVQYESGEHIFMGDQVVLKGLPTPPTGQTYQFTLDNGLKLSYGDIVAMPDYYGDPNHQVSSDPTLEKRKEWFTHLYNSFSSYDVDYFNKFWPIVQKERAQVLAALKAHQSVSKLYKSIIGKELLTLEIVTNFKFFALAENCFDHFGHDAWIAYQAGHSVAIDTAITGYQIKSGANDQANASCKAAPNAQSCLDQLAIEKLKLAYAENAYANHFLTDRLASSHMRTPFRALVTTRPIGALGAISGNFMHNEDGDFGIIVTNNSEKYWVAYGDDYYFSPENATHRAVIKQLLQQSADEVYQAYLNGYNPDPNSATLYKALPQPIPAGTTVTVPGLGQLTQSAPLYKVVAGSVWERQDVNNRFDNHWTASWSTLQLLLSYHLKRPTALLKQYIQAHPSIAKLIPFKI